MLRAYLVSAGLLLASVNVYADASACSTASLINPYSMEGGISGTGAPLEAGGVAGTGAPIAKGGVSGTGAPVAAGGLGGTGISVAKGGVSGTGSPLEAGGVAGTGDKVANGGILGTGAPIEKGGVSGTGAPIAAGGIGGTGDLVPAFALLPADASGNIGIMGVVTGFASICVNGEEVQYESSTPIFDNGKAVKLADLAVGKTVMLKVDKVNGVLHAKAIGLFNAVSGPVGNINASRLEVTVMGQTVKVNQNVIRQLSQVNNTNGTIVSVSGYRAEGGAVVASRIDVVKGASDSNTLGTITGLTHEGFVVNGTKVVVDRKLLEKVKVGSEVQVSGSWKDGVLKASRVETQPISNVVRRVDSAVLEGYVRTDSKNRLTISGTEVSAGQDTSLESFKDKLVKVELRRNNNGKFTAEKVTERKDNRIDNDIQFNDNSGKGSSGSGKEEGSSNSGSGDSSGSGSSNAGSGVSGSSNSGSSGSSSNSGRGSTSSGSSRGGGGSSSSGRSGGGSSSSGGSGRGGGGSSGGGSSGRSK